MIIGSHALVGAAVVVVVDCCLKKKLPRWAIWLGALLIAFNSHFVLDHFTHWDYRLVYPEGFMLVMADFLIAGGLIGLASRAPLDGLWGLWQRKLLFLGGLASIFPDIIVIVSRFFELGSGVLGAFQNFHSWAHYRPVLNTPPNFIGPQRSLLQQLIVMVVAAGIIRWLYRRDGE